MTISSLVAVPAYLMNKQAEKFTRNLTAMREAFDNSFVHDKIHRDNFADAVKSFANMPKMQEADAAEKFFAELTKQGEEGSERVRTFPLADMWVKVDQNKSWGMSSVEVGVSLEEAAAFLWMFDSRAFVQFTGEQDRRVTSTKSAFRKRVVRYRQMCTGNKKKGVKHVRRTFTNEMTFHRMDRDTIIIMSEPSKLDNNDQLDGLNAQNKAIERAISRGRRLSVAEKIR